MPRRAAADEQRGAHHDRAEHELADVAAEVDRGVARRSAAPRAKRAEHDADDGEERPAGAGCGDEELLALDVVEDPVREVAPVAGRAEAVCGGRRDVEPLAGDSRERPRRRFRRRSASAASGPARRRDVGPDALLIVASPCRRSFARRRRSEPAPPALGRGSRARDEAQARRRAARRRRAAPRNAMRPERPRDRPARRREFRVQLQLALHPSSIEPDPEQTVK